MNKKKFDIGIVILLIFSLILFIRFIAVVNKYQDKGYMYVNLLKIGLPLTGIQNTDDQDSIKNKISMKNLVFETLGLSNLSTDRIIANEISFFNGFSYDKNSSKCMSINPFELDETAIVKVSEENLVNKDLVKPLNTSKPEVLIYHTHTQEGYLEGGAQNSNSGNNVVGVGELVAKELEKTYGIAVIHDKNNYCITYNDSYNKSREGVQKHLNQYGDLKMIIDLHRDGIGNIENAIAKKININGVNTAKLMFVTCKNNPRFAKTQALSEAMTNSGNSIAPGLFNPINIYEAGKNRFNQDLSDNSVLIEVGSDLNTSAEAMATAKYIAKVIAEQVNAK